MLYAQVVSDETTVTFLDCHRSAFEYFGGTVEEILYDNAKVVALSRTKEAVIFNPSLIDFAGIYGFRPIVCKPFRPQTKGKVERSIRYIRDSFLEGEVFLDLADMQQKLLIWLESVANKRICSTTGIAPSMLLLSEDLKTLPEIKSSAKTLINIAKKNSFAIISAPQVQTRNLYSYEECCL